MSHLGVFDLFTIGIGPSSSHTVGPMRACRDFVLSLGDQSAEIAHLEVDLFGSLAATGRGHGTLSAVLLGLEGWDPQSVPASVVADRASEIDDAGSLLLGGHTPVAFSTDAIRLHPLTFLERHSNAIRLRAETADGRELDEATYFSIGGGFVEREGAAREEGPIDDEVPYPFDSAAELLALCDEHSLDVATLCLRNEAALRPESEVRARTLEIRDAMRDCTAAGIDRSGTLPGGLRVERRARAWHRKLAEIDPEPAVAHWQEWVNLVALAVNEENASGGRVVTAPTNGAAGIIPAVLFYATHFAPLPDETTDDDVAVRFLVVAAAIGSLYKRAASISGAEVGCQGEVGSASSMAAGALAAVMGGTPAQVENAAEIAMEHNLGLTCDPVGGLVQIPCIERNAIAAAKAINAARMALFGDGTHRVSLDTVIATMRETGKDMSAKYKETATGGLAVSVVEC